MLLIGSQRHQRAATLATGSDVYLMSKGEARAVSVQRLTQGSALATSRRIRALSADAKTGSQRDRVRDAGQPDARGILEMLRGVARSGIVLGRSRAGGASAGRS